MDDRDAAQKYVAAASAEFRKGCWEDSGHPRVLYTQLDCRGQVFGYMGSRHNRMIYSSMQNPAAVAEMLPARESSYWDFDGDFFRVIAEPEHADRSPGSNSP